MKRFDELFDEFELADEGWSKFNYRTEAAPACSDFDCEFIVDTKRS